MSSKAVKDPTYSLKVSNVDLAIAESEAGGRTVDQSRIDDDDWSIEVRKSTSLRPSLLETSADSPASFFGLPTAGSNHHLRSGRGRRDGSRGFGLGRRTYLRLPAFYPGQNRQVPPSPSSFRLSRNDSIPRQCFQSPRRRTIKHEHWRSLHQPRA